MPLNLSIHSNIRDYELYIEESPDFIEGLASHSQACFVVDENVWDAIKKESDISEFVNIQW